jgi:hypothetical protein
MKPYSRDVDRWVDAGASELDELPWIALAALAVLGLIDSIRQSR